MKFESPITYHLKDLANVKVFADKQTDIQRYTNIRTDGQAINYMPPIFRHRVIVIQGHFSTTYTEKNGPKAINSTKKGVVFLHRILTGGGVTFLRRKMTHGSIFYGSHFSLLHQDSYTTASVAPDNNHRHPQTKPRPYTWTIEP
jgi:hypothetical protein